MNPLLGAIGFVGFRRGVSGVKSVKGRRVARDEIYVIVLIGGGRPQRILNQTSSRMRLRPLDAFLPLALYIYYLFVARIEYMSQSANLD